MMMACEEQTKDPVNTNYVAYIRALSLIQFPLMRVIKA